MPTALTIVKRALRLAGVTESGETPSSDEQADGLEALNDLLGAWSANGWLVPYRTRDAAMAVASSKHSYSLGSGGDFNTGRPIRIDALTVNLDGVPYPVPERGVGDYNAAVVDAGHVPEFFWYEPTFPTGTLYFPSKLSTAMTVTIDSLKPFNSFTLISTDISFPPGYDELIKTNLAVAIAPEYGREVLASVAFRAEQALDWLMTQSNAHRYRSARLDPAIRGTGKRVFNIITDR